MTSQTNVTCARCQTSFETFNDDMADGLSSCVTSENTLYCGYGSSFDMSTFDISNIDVTVKPADTICDGCITVLLQTEQIQEIN